MKEDVGQILKRFWDKRGHKVTYSTGKGGKKPHLWLVRESTIAVRAAACILWCELRIDRKFTNATVWIDGKAVQPSADEVLGAGGDPKAAGLTTDRERKQRRADERETKRTKIEATSVKELLRALQSSTDKTEKRKLRGLLRRAGHKGGLTTAPVKKKKQKDKRGRRAKK